MFLTRTLVLNYYNYQPIIIHDLNFVSYLIFIETTSKNFWEVMI